SLPGMGWSTLPHPAVSRRLGIGGCSRSAARHRRVSRALTSTRLISRSRYSASARDLGLLGQLLPVRLPLRHAPAQRLDQAADLVGECPADVVVVTDLQAELPVEAILRGPRAAEDVHGAHVPLVERPLGLVPGGRALGEPPDPELAVADVHLLFLEDPL